MRSRGLIVAIAAVLLTVALPSVALCLTPRLTNELGLVFAGQDEYNGRQCVSCHRTSYAETLHGRHVTTGLVVSPPSSWTVFSGSGSIAASGAPAPGTGLRWFTAGGTYPIAGLTWMSMFDYEGDSRWPEEEPPLMFFSGSPSTSTVSPWNRVSGLGLTHTSPYYEYVMNTTALSDNTISSTCGMASCHFTGGTQPLSSTQTTWTIPNPAVVTQLTTQTPVQWARDTSYTANDFKSIAAASYDGLGVQCEHCHGSGLSDDDVGTKHWNTGTELAHRLPTVTINAQTVKSTTKSTLGRSDLCGVCHGLRSAPSVTGVVPYFFGYTSNLFARDFVSVNASRGANAPYTYTPTDEQFVSKPATYALYPNGNPRSGGHGGNQYWAWAASAHAVRVQYGLNDPDNLPGAKNTRFNLAGVTTLVECLRCHTGEGYLTSKVPQIEESPVKSVWDGYDVTKTTAGFMGQECVTCHNPHPGSSDASDTLRHADPAGMRSNYGRTTDNASMCEDCHNWQVEVLANSLPLSEFNPQALPGRVSHAQRELLHGMKRDGASVMWDVEDMGEFMPGAKCEDCHMPRTDTSAEYSSHRMMIQEPGDAATWGATGQDSCTICHEEAGETLAEARENLQEELEEWQAEVSEAGVEANAAVTAARLRAEYTSGGTGAKELYGRAWLNNNTYTNDGSTGAHNPPYILAGLKVATKMANSVGGTFDQLYATSRVTYGGLALIGANLNNGDDTDAVDATVALEKRVGGVWVQQGDPVQSNINGNASFLMSPVTTGDYRLRWDRCGNDNADMYSATKRITVVSITTAARSKSTVYYSSSTYSRRIFVLSGSVTPNAAGATVRIQAKKGSGSWRTIYTNTLSASSTYRRTIRPTSRGTWYYRTIYSGNAAVAGSTSPSVRVYCR